MKTAPSAAVADATRLTPTDRVSTFRDPRIEMAHGAGGSASRRLLEQLIVPLAGLPVGEPMSDAARLSVAGVPIALTADSFVVRPLRFPGGSIGEIAVNGTVNDLAVSGAKPLALLSTLIIEAGFGARDLEAEICALGAAAARAGVAIVGGDTKVVEAGKADGLYITTAGIGAVDPRLCLSARRVSVGDRVVVSGPIGDHGVTILVARGDLDLDADLMSDTRPVWPLVDALAEAAGDAVRWLRDPTRGGVATALNELARDARVTITIDEECVPMRDAVRGACELLGLDPLHIANEGQCLAIVAPDSAEMALRALHRATGTEDARVIGTITAASNGLVLCRSSYGSTRVIDMLVGDPLPRIC